MERLLFVDDDLEILEINRKYFETCGYHADTATDALAALSCLSEHTYQCIILDIHMEKTDGFCLCRTIRANYSIPVIFLTNLTDEEIMIESFDCGGDYKALSLKRTGNEDQGQNTKLPLHRSFLPDARTVRG